MNFSFQIITYGCKVNQYESQAIREYWQSLGGKEINQENQEPVDIFMIAGCAVTAQGVSDARQMVRKIDREHPESKVIATGCAAGAEPQDFTFDNVIACIPQTAKWNLLHHHPLKLSKDMDFEKQEKVFPEFNIQNFERSRPVLKIQDGCSHGCSYCIVPLTRGKARSRSPEKSIAELKTLLQAGFREIMISGINLRQYYAEKENFWGFLRRVHKELGDEWQGRARLRLSSLEPSQLNTEGLETLEECKLLCPHIHLSLQSGSPTVLERMGREHYSPEEISSIVNKLYAFWPKFALGADILMGFPGETDKEVRETLDMVDALPLTYAHVFPYSIRPNTKAATMSGHLEKQVRQHHAAQVREAIEVKKKAFMHSMLDCESMSLSLDIGEKNIGWNEFYVSCLLENAEQSHELQRVKAVRVEKDKLITQYITE